MSVKSMQDEIKQILNVYRHYVFLVAKHHSDGLPVIDGQEVPCEVINEEVPFSRNIENLVSKYPDNFKYEQERGLLIYDGCMDEDEYEEYKQMLSSSRELEALSALYEMSQIGDIYHPAEIIEGLDMLQYLDKTKCVDPQATAEELERAKDEAMASLQSMRNQMEDMQEQGDLSPVDKKLDTEYKILRVHSGEELVWEGILSKRVKRWCKSLGMPYKHEDITAFGK